MRIVRDDEQVVPEEVGNPVKKEEPVADANLDPDAADYAANIPDPNAKPEAPSLPIRFSNGYVVNLPVYSVQLHNKQQALSVSKVIPLYDHILLIAYGTIELMAVLDNREFMPKSIHLKFMVGGMRVSDSTFPFYVGNSVIIRSQEDHAMQRIMDVENKYSYSSLVKQAMEDKELFAAASIVRAKEISKLGLNLQSTVGFVDPNAISNSIVQKKGELQANKNMSPNLLYKGQQVPFIEFFLTHYTNINAVVL